MTTPTTAGLPEVAVSITADGDALIADAGQLQRIAAVNLADARARVGVELARRAAVAGQRIPVTITDPDGVWPLWWPAEGNPEARPPAPAPAPRPLRPLPTLQPDPEPEPEPTPAPAPAPAPAPVAEPERFPDLDTTPAPAPAPEAEAPHQTAGAGRLTLDAFVIHRDTPENAPAREGWQGALFQLSHGRWRLAPGPREQERRDIEARVRRDFGNTGRVVTLANPKGGAYKSTDGILLAHKFSELRGGYVCIIDANPSRGTLGWRTGKPADAPTIHDLVTDLDRFENDPRLGINDLAPYMRSSGSTLDVLATNDPPVFLDGAAHQSTGPKLSGDDLTRLLAVLRRFYRVIFIDTGNEMRESVWATAVLAADEMIIVSSVREDTAKSAAWLAQGLAESRRRPDLLTNAVTLLTQPQPTRDAAVRAASRDLDRDFRAVFGPPTTRALVDLPYEPALVHGGPIHFSGLSAETDLAVLRAAAAVADGL